jgi:sterol desaturase/sphingolipid hydroxylase (fatty acid hydroxylase superfamily)
MLLHTPRLYHLHKKHHTQTNIMVAVAGADTDFLDLLCNVVPAYLALLIVNAPDTTIFVFGMLAGFNQAYSHSGYLQQDGHYSTHQIHHIRRNVNFGVGAHIMDRLLSNYTSR